MQPSHIHYLPIALPWFAILVGILIGLFVLIEIGALRYAFLRLGLGRRAAFLLLLGSLIGSYVNIPVAQFSGRRAVVGAEVDFMGIPYVVPAVVDWPGTVIAVNIGGAAIPVVLSLYLAWRHRLWVLGAIATAIVAAIVHLLAQPVPGVGIAVPFFAPPVITAVTALALSRQYAAPLAYISGSLGTLIGADLLNLGRIPELGAPVASIGGAGTFDGVFLTGIVAVILASLPWPWAHERIAGNGDIHPAG